MCASVLEKEKLKIDLKKVTDRETLVHQTLLTALKSSFNLISQTPEIICGTFMTLSFHSKSYIISGSLPTTVPFVVLSLMIRRVVKGLCVLN